MLFAHEDLPHPPEGHPFHRLDRDGYMLGWFDGLTFGSVHPWAIEAVDEVIAEARRMFGELGLERVAWWDPSIAEPADLKSTLEAQGLVPGDVPPFEPRSARMVLVTEPEGAPTRVEAREVQDFDEYLEAARVSMGAFELSDADRRGFEDNAERSWQIECDARHLIRTFAAFLDGEIVGSASVLIGKRALHLSGGAVHPDARGQGAYRALVRARWDTAVELGKAALGVDAGKMSRPILERLGFRTIGWCDVLLDELGD